MANRQIDSFAGQVDDLLEEVKEAMLLANIEGRCDNQDEEVERLIFDLRELYENLPHAASTTSD